MKLISRKKTISSIKNVLFLYYSNKIKQEKWLDEKTRRIKEQTVRGLEPEIQRLLARHNAELAGIRTFHPKYNCPWTVCPYKVCFEIVCPEDKLY